MTDKRENRKGTMMNIPSVLKLIAAMFFSAILPAQVHALTPDQVFDKVKDSIVVVKTLDAQGKVKAQGSGVLLPSGKVATNSHVVEGGASYQVGRGEEFFIATLYAVDSDKDICLLDAKGITGKVAQLGKAVSLKVGDPVYAVGAPMGLELSLSNGIVAQLRGGPPPKIQTTAAISPGSSGGGLFDGEGLLVGLTTLYIEGGQSLNFAMPAEWINEIKPGPAPISENISNPAWLERAYALQDKKSWLDLLDWSQQWTKSEPKNAIAWYYLGKAYLVLAHDLRFTRYYENAITAYRQALLINPEDADTLFELGMAYTLTSKREAALDAVLELRRLDPKMADDLIDMISRH